MVLVKSLLVAIAEQMPQVVDTLHFLEQTDQCVGKEVVSGSAHHGRVELCVQSQERSGTRGIADDVARLA